MMSWNMASQQNQRPSHLRGFYTAATKIMLDHWSRVNWSPTVTKTTENIQDNKAAVVFQICHNWQ